jgi:hypothetical protein
MDLGLISLFILILYRQLPVPGAFLPTHLLAYHVGLASSRCCILSFLVRACSTRIWSLTCYGHVRAVVSKGSLELRC